MITNELDSPSDQSSKRNRKKLKGNTNENETTNLVPLRTFHMHSDTSLQIVVTRTFLSMLDTISKTLQASSGAGMKSEKSSSTIDYERMSSLVGEDAIDEYSAYEQEEEMLFEKFKNRVHQRRSDLSPSHSEDGYEIKGDEHHDDDNPSFNFLIRNELGVDVYLEAKHGFHVKRYFNLNLFSPPI